MSWDTENMDWGRVAVFTIIFSIFFGLVSGFTKTCTADLLDNNDPVYIYYGPDDDQWIDDVLD